ncbi:MAG: cysteine desulfurase family protein [Pseudomonadota bacterium]
MRVYLDHNATAPMRPEAKAAMLEAMELTGNPSSVHGEGRAAKALVERARGQIAAAFGAEGADIVFTSGATEAASLALAGASEIHAAEIEHDCVRAWLPELGPRLPVDADAQIDIAPALDAGVSVGIGAVVAVQAANSETGVLQRTDKIAERLAATELRPLLLVDAVQVAGKLPWVFNWSGADMALISAHKFGGPKGVGALILRRGLDLPAILKGGGQEMGRRSGTENIAGIAGFGAAATAAIQDVENGAWARVEKLRNILEKTMEDADPELIFAGKISARLPNTSCIVAPAWKGETQVMQMDLAGFAISAGSACSSGKVKASAALMAMGFTEGQAARAIRVSLGAETTRGDIDRFANAWLAAYERHKARAA